jgi:predicted nucleic acid-binding protein
MIVLDAGVLIGHFEPADAHHTETTALLKANVLESFGASVIILAEVYTGAGLAGKADQLEHLLAELQVGSLNLPADAARRLGELRATTRLKMPDCCVLYTAEQYGAAIATFDEKLADHAADLGLSVTTNPGRVTS